MSRPQLPFLPILVLAAAALLPAPRAARALPAISLNPVTVDFGSLNQQQTAMREVTIRNNGDEDLVISDVYSSCPCTLPELRTEVIPPGGQTVLLINFYSKDLQGLEERSVEISSNDPARPLVALPVSVYIRAPIFVEPENRSLDFGDVPRGETAVRVAKLHAQELESLEVEAVMVNRELFEVEILAAPDGDPAKAVVQLALQPEAPAGSFREILRLESNVPGMASIDLEASGKILSDLQVEPELVNWRFVQPGQSLSKELLVTVKDAPPDFTVTGVEIDLTGVTATVENLAGGQARVLLTGTALPADDPLVKQTRGRLKGELKIFTNHPEQPELVVKVLYMMRV